MKSAKRNRKLNIDELRKFKNGNFMFHPLLLKQIEHFFFELRLLVN